MRHDSLRVIMAPLGAIFTLYGMTESGVRRAKAAFSQWARDPRDYRSSRKQQLERELGRI
jgi:hypothetical protein